MYPSFTWLKKMSTDTLTLLKDFILSCDQSQARQSAQTNMVQHRFPYRADRENKTYFIVSQECGIPERKKGDPPDLLFVKPSGLWVFWRSPFLKGIMMENNCDKCLWATRSGGCASWSCEFVDKREAYEAWQNAKDRIYIPDVYKVAKLGGEVRNE